MAMLRDRSRKAAISLNNAAVSLLVRGYAREAAETFEDAIRLIFASRKEEVTMASTECAWGESIQQALNRAHRRSALASKSVVPNDTSQWPVLQVISSQSNPARVYDTLTACRDTASLRVSFPMTIDPIDCDSYSQDDVNFEAGIALYNYGVAHDCAIASSVVANLDDAYLRETIQAEAYRIYQWAYSTIATVDQNQCTRCKSSSCCTTSRLLLLQTALFHNMIHASILLNLQAEYHVYCGSMANLLHTVERKQAAMPMLDNAIAAAA
jgi:hypothetical protein